MSKSSSSKFKSTSVIIEYSDSDSDDVIVNGIESLDIGDIIEKIKPNDDNFFNYILGDNIHINVEIRDKGEHFNLSFPLSLF